MAKGKGVLLNKKLSSFHNILYWIKIYTDLHTAFCFWFCVLPINDYLN